MQTRIRTALTQLEATHGIRILYACESGSRAWGFHSLAAQLLRRVRNAFYTT
ncbi:DNA polymerase beta superfamily protein [Hymenobacter sp. B1770]|uniref:DNA polymerase beta superfamily protein n=1 Tax=Hymenobacter sp. B1770 TaxID=1718788 RepID=UPI003CE7DC4C